MSTLPRLLAQLKEKGVELYRSGDKLQYRAAVGALGAEDKAMVRSRRDGIMQYLRALEAAGRPPIPRATSIVPSFGQRLWWKWITSAPAPPPPQLIHVVKTWKNVEIASVESAIRQLLVRYRNLRSRFELRDGDLVVQLNDPATFQVEVEHLIAPEATPIDAFLEDKANSFMARNMLVSDDWLVRAKLFVAEKTGTVAAVVSTNHLLIDGPSQLLMSAELDRIMDRARNGAAPHEAAQSIDFFDYAEWERRWFNERGSDLVDYWRQWSQSIPALQIAGTRKELAWCPGYRVPYLFVLPRRINAGIREWAASLSTTRFIVYLTAFSIALSRWSGQERFGIRSAGDGRMQDEQLSSVVGCMTIADPVEINVNPSASFAANLKVLEPDYRSSWQMRLPSLHAYPPHIVDPPMDAGSLPNKFAVQINYHPPGALADQPPAAKEEFSQWPPVVRTLEALYWTHPVLAISLDIVDQNGDGAVEGYFRFNSTLLTESERAALIRKFFDVLSENLQ